MTSFGLIFKLVLGLVVLAAFGVVQWMIPVCGFVSWLILDLFGLFARDKEYLRSEMAERKGEVDEEERDEEGLTQRQIDFRRKMEEGRRPEGAVDARIVTTDKEGNVSSIVIKASGEIEIEGEPPEDLLEAAFRLKSSIEHFGPEAVANEIKRQIEEADERD